MVLGDGTKCKTCFGCLELSCKIVDQIVKSGPNYKSRTKCIFGRKWTQKSSSLKQTWIRCILNRLLGGISPSLGLYYSFWWEKPPFTNWDFDSFPSRANMAWSQWNRTKETGLTRITELKLKKKKIQKFCSWDNVIYCIQMNLKRDMVYITLIVTIMSVKGQSWSSWKRAANNGFPRLVSISR